MGFHPRMIYAFLNIKNAYGVFPPAKQNSMCAIAAKSAHRRPVPKLDSKVLPEYQKRPSPIAHVGKSEMLYERRLMGKIGSSQTRKFRWVDRGGADLEIETKKQSLFLEPFF